MEPVHRSRDPLACSCCYCCFCLNAVLHFLPQRPLVPPWAERWGRYEGLNSHYSIIAFQHMPSCDYSVALQSCVSGVCLTSFWQPNVFYARSFVSSERRTWFLRFLVDLKYLIWCFVLVVFFFFNRASFTFRFGVLRAVQITHCFPLLVASAGLSRFVSWFRAGTSWVCCCLINGKFLITNGFMSKRKWVFLSLQQLFF